MSFFRAIPRKLNSLMQMYKIIEETYTASLTYWLLLLRFLLFDNLLLINGKLRFNSNKKDLEN